MYSNLTGSTLPGILTSYMIGWVESHAIFKIISYSNSDPIVFFSNYYRTRCTTFTAINKSKTSHTAISQLHIASTTVIIHKLPVQLQCHSHSSMKVNSGTHTPHLTSNAFFSMLFCTFSPYITNTVQIHWFSCNLMSLYFITQDFSTRTTKNKPPVKALIVFQSTHKPDVAPFISKKRSLCSIMSLSSLYRPKYHNNYFWRPTNRTSAFTRYHFSCRNYSFLYTKL